MLSSSSLPWADTTEPTPKLMTFTELVRKNIRFVILFPAVVAAVVFAISLFQQDLYKSSLSLMVVQKQTEEVNAQTGVKSAEQMADILSRVIDSSSFRSAVLADRNIKLDLPEQPWKQAKEWREIVKTKNITDTGILIVDVYQPTTSQATKLAETIQMTLIDQSYGYLGTRAEDVFIRQLNPPAPTSDKPAKPNLLLNSAVGFLFGLVAALTLLLLFPSFGTLKPAKPMTKPENVLSEEETWQVPLDKNLSGGMIFSANLIKNLSHPMAHKHREVEAEEIPTPEEIPAANRSDENEINFVSRANDILNRKF